MRKPRRIVKGADYHITSRINRQEHIFLPKEVKDMFLKVVRRAKLKYSFSIKNFCIMNNHVHFILTPLKNDSLSDIMRWILGVFAQSYNKKYNLKGHVWYDRFKSKVIESFRQFINTFLYISNNPVKAGIVNKALDYQYSGIADLKTGDTTIMERPPTILLRYFWKKLT